MSRYEEYNLARMINYALIHPNMKLLWVFATEASRDDHLRRYDQVYEGLLKLGATYHAARHEYTLPNRSRLVLHVAYTPHDVEPLRGIEWDDWSYTDDPYLSTGILQQIRVLIRGRRREENPL